MGTRVSSTISKYLVALTIAAGALVLGWYWTHPRVTDAAPTAECRQYYAIAKTQADTTRVDGRVPENAGKSQAGINCGDLRRAYPDLFAMQ